MRLRIGVLALLCACGGSGRPPPDAPAAGTDAAVRPDAPSGPPDAPSGPPDAPSGPPDAPSGPPDGSSGPPDARPSPPDAPAPPTLLELTAGAGRMGGGGYTLDLRFGQAVGPLQASGGAYTLEDASFQGGP